MTSDVPVLVSLDNAGVLRAGKWLVRGITLSVSRGEIVTLIGPNGSGKSTTAKLALGNLKCDEGSFKIDRKAVVSYVPQKLDLDWSLPLNVKRFLSLGGSTTPENVDWAIEVTNIRQLLHLPLGDVSGGEFQRVQIARAIARRPNLLVLDEPTQGVDFVGQGELYDLIKNVRDTLNCGILLVSHDLHIVMAATDRVFCLNGHICCSGSPMTVAESQEFKELFGHALNPAFAVYEHQHDHKHLPDGRVQHADGSITDHCHEYDGHHELVSDDNPDLKEQRRV